MAVANASGALSSQSTSDVGSSRSTTRTSTALTTPPTISASPPKTTTSPAKTTATTPQPTPAATALSPNHYGIVYIRTASGRTTCMISAEQVACQANQSTWPTNGVAISTDGSTTYKDGDFGNIAHQIQTIGYQRYTAVGWTIAASSTGTRFTNDRTGHGAFVSVEQVQNF